MSDVRQASCLFVCACAHVRMYASVCTQEKVGLSEIVGRELIFFLSLAVDLCQRNVPVVVTPTVPLMSCWLSLTLFPEPEGTLGGNNFYSFQRRYVSRENRHVYLRRGGSSRSNHEAYS